VAEKLSPADGRPKRPWPKRVEPKKTKQIYRQSALQSFEPRRQSITLPAWACCCPSKYRQREFATRSRNSSPTAESIARAHSGIRAKLARTTPGRIALFLWKSVCPVYFFAAHKSSPSSAKILRRERFAAETRRPAWRRGVHLEIRSNQPPVAFLGRKGARAFACAAAY